MLENWPYRGVEKVTLPHMSVDEVAWQKWHKYVTNVIDIDNRKLFGTTKERGKNSPG